MQRRLTFLFGLMVIGLSVFWFLTIPKQSDPQSIAGMVPELERGEYVFTAAGCASCHAAPGAEGEARLVLSGGQAFASPFGTFYAPNISSDPVLGIGSWSALDLLNAMQNGTTPDGQHLYPAFPYASYIRANPADIVSLHAYLQTLPSSDIASRAHDVGFPFNIRRTLGGWKMLFLRKGWVFETPTSEPAIRGRYLVEALGHCGECHTPRNALGGLKTSKWLGGAPNPAGKGSFPNITPGGLDWGVDDIAYYLETGFTPDFDSAGGHMAEVVANFSALSAQDRADVAAYLAEIPAIR